MNDEKNIPKMNVPIIVIAVFLNKGCLFNTPCSNRKIYADILIP